MILQKMEFDRFEHIFTGEALDYQLGIPINNKVLNVFLDCKMKTKLAASYEFNNIVGGLSEVYVEL